MSRAIEAWRTWRAIIAALFAGIIFLIAPQTAAAQKISSREDIGAILALEKIAISNGTVSGAVRNRSPYVVRDVQLLIRYTWLWDDERKPGKNDPSTSTYYNLPSEIQAGESAPFTFTPSPPLLMPPGGRYEISVTVGGFAQVVPQTK